MPDYIKKIRTDKGDCQIDYTALANLPSSMKNPHPITFTGAASATYDGSAPINVEIPNPAEPFSPEPLTFTGAVSAQYDGTAPVTVNIPESYDLEELVDIRTGYDGTKYDTAGEAVREQIEKVYTDISYTDFFSIDTENLNWEDGFYNRTASLTSDSGTKHAAIQVSEGQKFKLSGAINYYLSFYVIVDKLENRTKYISFPSDYTNVGYQKFENLEVTIPSGMNYLIISQLRTIEDLLSISEYRYLNIKDVDDKVTGLESYVQDVENETIELESSVQEIESSIYRIEYNRYQEPESSDVGWMYSDGRLAYGGSRKVFGVSGYRTAKVTAYGGGDCPFCIFVDSNNNTISFLNNNVAFELETRVVNIPENCKSVVVNDVEGGYDDELKVFLPSINTNFIKELLSSLSNSDDEIKTEIAEVKNSVSDNRFSICAIKSNIIDLQERNDFSWKQFDGLYATITFDDTNSDIDVLEDLAEELNIPFCFATIPSRLNNIMSKGTETAQQTLERAVLNGGEILSHWQTQLNSYSTEEDYYSVYIGSKRDLENAGFEVNGIITAGGGADGTPESFKTQNWETCIKLARIYYRYADLTANSFGSTDYRYIEQFYNDRKFTDVGLESMKQYIDGLAEQGIGWLNMASHGTNNPNTNSVEVFRQIFQYALDKGFTFVTWNQMYNKFKSSKLEKLILEAQ